MDKLFTSCLIWLPHQETKILLRRSIATSWNYLFQLAPTCIALSTTPPLSATRSASCWTPWLPPSFSRPRSISPLTSSGCILFNVLIPTLSTRAQATAYDINPQISTSRWVPFTPDYQPTTPTWTYQVNVNIKTLITKNFCPRLRFAQNIACKYRRTIKMNSQCFKSINCVETEIFTHKSV